MKYHRSSARNGDVNFPPCRGEGALAASSSPAATPLNGLLADRVDACLCVHDSDDHYLREGVEVVGLHAPATKAA